VVQQKEEAPKVVKTATTNQLKQKEQSGVHRISQLENMKAIVKKAEEDPTPENIQAAMAAQRQLADKPESQPTIVSNAADVADMIKTRMQATTAPAAPAAAPAKQETQPEEEKPESDAALKSQKASAQSDIDQLNSLKDVIKKAMTDPSDANIAAAMDAQKKLQALSHHQQEAAPAAPEAASAAPTEATQTSGPLAHTNKKQVDVTGYTAVTHAHLAHGQHHLAAKEEKGVNRINQLEELKAVVRRAMKNPTPENVQAAMNAEAQMKKGASGAGKEEAPQPEPEEKEEEPEKAAPAPAAKEQKVEFNLDIDNLGKIKVHKGDKAADLAQAFAKEHSLNDAMAKKLESMIQGQMKAHNIM